MTLRVVVADDSYLVREGVRRLLEDGPEVRVVGDAGSAPELLARVREIGPDAVLTDIRMPPRHAMDGIEAALAIRSEHPGTGVAVLSQHADAAYARALFRDGTGGLAYLLKERVGDRDELVRSLTAVAAGDSFVDPLVVDALMRAQRREQGSPLATLSDREHDVLRLMARGHTNGAIAAELFVSESAVSKHVGSIFAKLGLVDDGAVDRRVRAVLAYVTHRSDDAGPQSRGGT